MTYDIGTPNPRQLEFFLARARHIAYGGARGGGKSWAMRKKLVLLCLGYAGISCLLLRRTLPELLENHITPLQRELHGIAKYNKSEKVFKFPNGSRLKLGYCDSESDVYQYQGQEYPIIGLEEATHFTEEQRSFLTTCNRTSTKGYPLRMYYTCNPGNVGHAWVKRLFIDRKYQRSERPEDYVFIPARVYDNTALMEADPDYVRELENLREDQRRAFLDGDWSIFQGQFFAGWNEDVHVIDPFPIPEHWLRFRAIDYGFDRLVCLWATTDEHGNMFIYQEWCQSGLTISEAAQGILARSSGRELCTFAPFDLTSKSHDTGVARDETFAQCGLPLTIVQNGRVAGWNNMAEWLRIPDDGQPPRLRIFRNCQELKDNIPQLQHSKNNVEDCATEPHEITHAPDACRYLLDGRPQASPPLRMPRGPFDPVPYDEQGSSFINYGI